MQYKFRAAIGVLNVHYELNALFLAEMLRLFDSGAHSSSDPQSIIYGNCICTK